MQINSYKVTVVPSIHSFSFRVCSVLYISGSGSISNRVVPKPSQAIDRHWWWCHSGSVSVVPVVPFEKSSGARAPLAPPLTEPLMNIFGVFIALFEENGFAWLMKKKAK